MNWFIQLLDKLIYNQMQRELNIVVNFLKTKIYC